MSLWKSRRTLQVLVHFLERTNERINPLKQQRKMTNIRSLFSWRADLTIVDAMQCLVWHLQRHYSGYKAPILNWSGILHFSVGPTRTWAVHPWALWAFMYIALLFILKRCLYIKIYINSPGYEEKRPKYIFHTNNTATIKTRFWLIGSWSIYPKLYR